MLYMSISQLIQRKKRHSHWGVSRWLWVGDTMRNVAKFVAGLLWDVLGPIGITVISTALLFIAVEAVRWWLGD